MENSRRVLVVSVILLTTIAPCAYAGLVNNVCSAIFRALYWRRHYHGPRSVEDYRTPQSPPEHEQLPDATRVLDDRMHKMYGRLDDLSVSQLTRLSRNQAAREELAREYFPDASAENIAREANRIWLEAAVLLSRRATPNLVAGQPLTQRQFAYQAGLLGLTPRPIERTYRMDSRPPGVIAREGFSPNPNKRPFTLWENVDPTVRGGANFVSVTLDAANPTAADSLTEVSRATSFNQSSPQNQRQTDALTQAQEALRSRFPDEADRPQIASIRIREGYEYSIRQLPAIIPPDFSTNPMEREAVARTVPARFVREFRPVSVVYVEFTPAATPIRVIETGEWETVR